MFRPRSIGFSVILTVFVLFLYITASLAQDTNTERKIIEWTKTLDTIEKTLKRTDVIDEAIDITDEAIVRIRTKLPSLQDDTRKLLSKETPKLKALEGQMKELGPEPKDMSAAVAKIRATQKALLDKQRSLINSLNLVRVRAGQLDGVASEIQRNRFLSRLLSRAGTPLNPSLWLKAADNLSDLPSRIAFLYSSWAGHKTAFSDGARYIIIFLAIITALLIAFPLHNWVRRYAKPVSGKDRPDNAWHLFASFKVGLVDILLPIIAIVIFYAILKTTGLLSLRLESLVIILMSALAWSVTIRGVARAILSPDVSSWRLVNLSDIASQRIYKFITLSAYIIGFYIFFSGLTALLFLPLPIAITSTALTSVLIAILLMAILYTPISTTETPVSKTKSSNYFAWVVRLRKPLWLYAGAIIISTLLGYIALGYFLSVQLVRTSLLIATLYAFHLLADEVLYSKSKSGAKSQGVSHQNILGRFGPALAILIDFLLVLIALPLILLQWGSSQEDLYSWVSAAFLGFNFGDVRISLSSILIALAVLLSGIMITNLLQRWLDTRLLSKIHLDVGVRNSLRMGLGYAGYLLTFLIAISYGGADFTDIAIVAGALSVGIGFGLQGIVNNFVSGLILLAERPFKAGDWVVVGGEEGYVKKISVRATEVMTFNKATLTVPNSEMISKTVKNWTHGGTLGRVIVKIGVAYNTPPEQVRDILLNCAKQHKEVKNDPAANVLFSDFGDSALEFELRAFIVNIDRRLHVCSDLRFAIFRDLKDADIEIPYPQRDIHIKQGNISAQPSKRVK